MYSPRVVRSWGKRQLDNRQTALGREAEEDWEPALGGRKRISWMDSCSGFSSSRVSHIGVVVRFSRYNTAHQNLRAEVDYVNGLQEELQGAIGCKPGRPRAVCGSRPAMS